MAIEAPKLTRSDNSSYLETSRDGLLRFVRMRIAFLGVVLVFLLGLGVVLVFTMTGFVFVFRRTRPLSFPFPAARWRGVATRTLQLPERAAERFDLPFVGVFLAFGELGQFQ